VCGPGTYLLGIKRVVLGDVDAMARLRKGSAYLNSPLIKRDVRRAELLQRRAFHVALDVRVGCRHELQKAGWVCSETAHGQILGEHVGMRAQVDGSSDRPIDED
jgi:hypothetical protein